ncbi:HAD family hydrolase [Pacificoceanicola onchidii]|uniref:HAD family hydrolase n=1 Tax=Pacificoceanicola onchidii TaxID=2562685 RepID=UPI0010A63E4F|nr:HAD family hydrolase [Pacificoceanicola onchidii]
MDGAIQTGLVIFDCDGVLVDSEPISLAVTLEHLAQLDCPMTEAEGYDHLLGKSSSSNADWLRQTYRLEWSDTQVEDMRTALYARFQESLTAIPGVADAIQRLPWPACVASSSQPDRIQLSLSLTGLDTVLGTHIYSATMVENGKPAPDLFLYAAKQRGIAPEHCIVVEDSPAGVAAAKAAGMRVIGFVGGSHAGPANLKDKLAKLQPDAIIGHMNDLPGTIEMLSNTR